MAVTSYWHPDGTPVSAQELLDLLYGKVPEFFRDEAELRELWSAPDTRKKLLQGLAEKGFGPEQLAEMQKIIDAEKSDLFDVLAYVRYKLPPETREERAAKAKIAITTHFNSQQQVFLDFVLSHYVTVGVEELDQEKTHPAAAPEVSQFHRRRRGRSRSARSDRKGVRKFPEIPLRASGLIPGQRRAHQRQPEAESRCRQRRFLPCPGRRSGHIPTLFRQPAGAKTEGWLSPV